MKQYFSNLLQWNVKLSKYHNHDQPKHTVDKAYPFKYRQLRKEAYLLLENIIYW